MAFGDRRSSALNVRVLPGSVTRCSLAHSVSDNPMLLVQDALVEDLNRTDVGKRIYHESGLLPFGAEECWISSIGDTARFDITIMTEIDHITSSNTTGPP